MRAAAATVALTLLLVGCGRIRSTLAAIGPPTVTPTPSWVGQVRAEGQPFQTYLAKVAEVDERSGRPLTTRLALREAPGRGSEPNGVTLGPGERIFLVATESIGGERFFQVRSFDGLRRGWLPETALAPQDRPR